MIAGTVMHQGFNPYSAKAADAICHFCVDFGGWRPGGVWCLKTKILCANGAGCAFFRRAPLPFGQEPEE